MGSKIRVTKRGYCQEQDRPYEIDIDFAEIRMVGDPNTYYKKCGFLCEYYNEHGCKSCAPGGENCGIFKAAQSP